jgi:Uma2 family endonuclease
LICDRNLAKEKTMTTPPTNSKRWTTADLEALDDDPWYRYEIIDGELYVTRAPHWNHQQTCMKIGFAITSWSQQTGAGQIVTTPGVIFSEVDSVIPDLVWASSETLAQSLDAAGHLTSAPELIIEVLSAGKSNEDRDRRIKLQLYCSQDVQAYWICDWRARKIEIYRRQDDSLKLIETLRSNDELITPLLPGFRAQVSDLLAN